MLSCAVETIKSIPRTFYSPSFYHRLARQGCGIGMGYILVLTIIMALVAGLTTYAPFRMIVAQADTIFDTLPNMTIRDGKLSIDAPSPWSMRINSAPAAQPGKTTDNAPYQIIIDTSYAGDIGDLTERMEKEKILVFVTPDKLLMLKRDSEIDIHDLSKTPDQTISHENWVRYGKIFHDWFFPFIALIVVLGMFLSTLFWTFVIAIVMRILITMGSLQTTFGAMMRLSAAAAVPILLVTTFVPCPFFLKAAVWLGYGIFGLYAANREPKNAPTIGTA